MFQPLLRSIALSLPDLFFSIAVLATLTCISTSLSGLLSRRRNRALHRLALGSGAIVTGYLTYLCAAFGR